MSNIFRIAVRAPDAAGVNVTLIVQLAPTATVVPQVLVCEKSPALVPVIEMLLMSRGTLPVLVSVLDIGLLVLPTYWLPNPRLVLERVTAGACTRIETVLLL